MISGLLSHDRLLDRYSRQIALKVVGVEGQRRLARSSVAVIGCGALGTAVAELLARAGVGRLKLVDRDIVEISNLHRQLLYDERHAIQGAPKALACAEKISEINSEVEVEPVVADVSHRNVLNLISDVDLVIDGTDNFETRFLLNDAALSVGVPWVYGAALETYGVVMPILPGRSACLRDLIPNPPRPGALPTCELVGVLNAAAVTVASLQVASAIKLLLGDEEGAGVATYVDVWRHSLERVRVERSEDCPACVRGRYEFLEGKMSRDVVLCGRNAVQISPARDVALDLEELANRLRRTAEVRETPHVLFVRAEGLELAIFRDGRAIVKGTSDPARARSAYARYVGL